MKPMKTILFLIFSAFSISVFSQIQQNVNKSTGTVTKPITQIDSIRFNTSTNQMEIIQTNGNADNHTISDVINVTFSGQLLGTISTLDCSSANNTGSLTAYSAASGVSSTISYTGGNGGVYNGQTVTSTGVTGLTATLTAGAFAVGAGTLTYNITGTPNSSGTASFSINIGGKTCTLTWTVVLPIGSVSFLNCGNATNTGTLIEGTAASGVSSNIPYSGGNGGTHNGQTVTSTGVTGLTATLNSGTFALGAGSLIYDITGTPNGNGTASFLLNIGGKSCTLTINVELPAGTISLLDCANTTNTGTLVAYSAASGVSSSIPYTGGNGGTYSSQSISSTGVTGLTADLNAGILSNGNGTLNFIISGTPSGDGIATFLVDVGGQSCSLTWTVNLPIGEITGSLDCGSATNTGTLTAYETANGVSSSVPYYGGNGGSHSGQTVNSTGVTGLTATVTSGIFEYGNGTLVYSISGVPSSDGIATFLIEIGGQICYLDIPVNLPVGTITVLSCGSATNTGVLAEGVLASGVSSSIAYSGGNGGTYNGETVNSTGVTGLTATLDPSIFANGNGNLVYTITGTPASGGTASFSLNIGGQTCVLIRNVGGYPAGTIHCNGIPTAVVDVTSPTTGKTWMDRNLGSPQIATFHANFQSYGDYYQWGRRADGHQCRNSSVTSVLSSVDQPAHGDFIQGSFSILDWRSPYNNNLWQGVNGINNPCPNGYRIPDRIELGQEVVSGNFAGFNNSPLKLPAAGARDGMTNNVMDAGTRGYYWTSSVSLNNQVKVHGLTFNQTTFNMLEYLDRNSGRSVRCIKN
jgi:hypothetical protein